MWAARRGDIEMARDLLVAGANLELENNVSGARVTTSPGTALVEAYPRWQCQARTTTLTRCAACVPSTERRVGAVNDEPQDARPPVARGVHWRGVRERAGVRTRTPQPHLDPPLVSFQRRTCVGTRLQVHGQALASGRGTVSRRDRSIVTSQSCIWAPEQRWRVVDEGTWWRRLVRGRARYRCAPGAGCGAVSAHGNQQCA